MSWLKPCLLQLYYGLQYPRLQRAAERRAAAGKAPVLILCYHRIADDRATPWTQSNRSFARQISWLQRHFDMVSLDEAQRRIRAGRNERATVSITFDDGYADNCAAALPLLIRERIPCTYFVSSGNVISGTPFPHDAHIAETLPINSLAELREMSAAGIEIGVHSRTHADLGQVDDLPRLYEELVVAGQELQSAIGQKMRYFAFPYGKPANLNPHAFELGRKHGYKGMCSAYGGANFPGDDSYHLQRITVDSLLVRLKNWVMLDPRKMNSVRRYEYIGRNLDTAGAGLQALPPMSGDELVLMGAESP